MLGNKENISYEFRLTKFGKLGKSGLIESNLGDFGVRKYDYESKNKYQIMLATNENIAYIANVQHLKDVGHFNNIYK